MEHLAFAPAVALASMIRHKDISARELLECYLQRVEHYNPRLNAIIFRQDEQARQRADAADAALARGEVWGPLHGVPMTIKECFDWIGSPSTWGNPGYQYNYPPRDARGRGAAADRRRHYLREDQRPPDVGRLAELQCRLWHHQQSLGI